MEPANTLVINIVTWNHARFLPHLFESIDAQTSRAFTVTVVDNASSDGTVPWLEEKARHVPVLKNYRNQGFSRAHNQAIALALQRWEREGGLDRKYILILNPDIVLAPTCIAQLISYMDAHPDVDLAGPKLLRAIRTTDDEGQISEIERSRIIDSTGLRLFKSRRAVDRGAGEEDNGQYDGQPPFGISGAAMLFRASVIPLVTLGDGQVFDEDFFAYKEDVDLCWRMRLLGKHIALVPGAVAWHHRAARAADSGGFLDQYRTQRERANLIVALSSRNQIWTEWKNDDRSSRLIHLPWILVEKLRRLAGAVLFPASRLRGIVQAWSRSGAMRKKRAEIMARRTASPSTMRSLFS